MVTLPKNSYKFESKWAIRLLFFLTTFDLSFLNDKEMITVIVLVEHILTGCHMHHFQPVDESELLEALKALEEFYFVEVL